MLALAAAALAPLAALPPAVAQAQDAAPNGLRYECGPIAITSAQGEPTQIVQGADGVFFRPRSDFSNLLWPSAQVLNKFRRLNDLFEARGIELVLVPVPPSALVFHDSLGPLEAQGFVVDPDIIAAKFDRALNLFESIGITVPEYRAADFLEPEAADMFFKTDIHWAYPGVSFVAGAVAASIGAELGADRLRDAPLPVSRFESVRAAGSMYTAISSACDGDIEVPVVQRPIVEVKAETSSDLFGDGGKNVAIVGSSFSGPLYGFDNELSRYLTQNIVNLQIDGGQIATSMISTLTSEEYHSGIYDLIIWETLLNYDLDRMSTVFREMPALAAGRCSGSAVIAEGRFEAGATAKLAIPKDRNISGEDFYVWVDHVDLSPKQTGITIRYADGDSEIMAFDHAELSSSTGIFARELHEAIPSQVVEVELEQAAAGPVDMALCRSPLRKEVQ
jgi:alginate biosynthesis protein AlgX